MNRDQLKKNVGRRVKIQPAAIHLDALGRERPTRNEDWTVVDVTDDEVRIEEDAVTPLTTRFGIDAVASFTSDPSRSVGDGKQYGFLLLKVQMYIQGDVITFASCLRPGERLPPPAVQIVDRRVGIGFARETGLEKRMAINGFRLYWAKLSSIAQLEREGWEILLEPDEHGILTRYHVSTRPENQVLMRTREPDLQSLVHIFDGRPGFVRQMLTTFCTSLWLSSTVGLAL